MRDSEMTCKELVEVVTDYLEGHMPVDRRRLFDDHLSSCSACRAYIAQMRVTIQLIGTLREDDVSVEARDALLDVLRGWKRR
jgi:predicted anti-sigma-YlaC factor YlaD